jgi:hypothetical protein
MALTHAPARRARAVARPAPPRAFTASPRSTPALPIGAPHDAAEEEAERVSAQVLRGERVSVGTVPSSWTLARACAACAEAETESEQPTLQRRAIASSQS